MKSQFFSTSWYHISRSDGMQLDLDGRGTRYEQLARALKRSILEGRLKPGVRLPATRELAADLGLSRNTVLTAYELLCAERLAGARSGSGTYVTDAAIAHAARTPVVSVPPQSRYAARLRRLPPNPLRRFDPPVRYDLQYGEPLLDLPLVTAWRRELARAATRAELRYPLVNGLRELREAICEYLARRRGVACRPSDVVIVNGAQQAIALVARVLVDDGDTVALEDPHYPLAAHAYRAHGAQLAAVRTDAEGLDWQALPRGGARLVHVTPAHQFPSGVEMSLARRLALLRYAAERRVWVVEDDYDGEFRYERGAVPALRSLDVHDRVVYVGTFSKIVFPALRLGYIVAPRSLRDDFVSAKRLDDLGSGAIEQTAMAAFMRGGGFDRHLRKAALELRRRREALLAGLRRHCARHLEVAGAQAGMHMVGWLPGWPAARTAALVELGRERGLGLHPIDPYFAEPPPRSGLLLGFAGLSAKQLQAATRILGACLSDAAER
jgi:GntR family transcriptional regulator/MocR family aminotransferase